MRTDKDGRSTCKPGEEHWEEYWSFTLGKNLIQYDYRTPGGKLFSCIDLSLDLARKQKNKWLERNPAEYPETIPGISEPEFRKEYPGEWREIES